MTARLPISLAIFEMLTADELHRFPTLDHWLTRPLSKLQAEGLSPEAKLHRRLAQVRACRHRQKLAKAVACHDAPASDRDIIDLYASHIIDS
jgi:hypothetical protein